MACAVMFAACSDDDGDAGEWMGAKASVDCDAYESWTYFDFETGKTVKTLGVETEAGGVAGMYTGGAEIRVMGSSQGTLEGVEVNVTKTGTMFLVTVDTVELSMAGKVYKVAFSEEVTAEEGDGEWTVASEAEDVMCGDLALNELTVNGTIASAADGVAELTFSFKPGGMPMPVEVVFASTERVSNVYVLEGDEGAFDWDIAFHRYEIKTNGGAAVMLNTTDLAGVSMTDAAGATFAADVAGEVMVDMSHMMEGFVGYLSTNVNEVLGQWVTATPTGSMPPYVYELNEKVFIVRLADGTYAKMQFTDTSDATGKKEMASFNYEYPLQ